MRPEQAEIDRLRREVAWLRAERDIKKRPPRSSRGTSLMTFTFIAKHRAVWPVAWICAAQNVSRSGFHAWLTRFPSQCARDDAAILTKLPTSFVGSDRTYGASRVWHDLLARSSTPST